MVDNDYLHDALKHVRLIHFALVVVLATILYILFFAWSDSHFVLGELEALSNTITTLAEKAKGVNGEERSKHGQQLLPMDLVDLRAENILKTIEESLEINTPQQRINKEQIKEAKRFDRESLLSRFDPGWPSPYTRVVL